jgi:cation:H+ antiporter
MNTLLLFSMVPSQMWLQAVVLIVSIGFVMWGASLLTQGAVGLAERMGIPQIVIGLTIVAMGTSMPEFFVSLVSAINGTPDLAVGNIVGSNIFNALFIVGCAAIVAPISILKGTVRKDIPFAMIASITLLLMCLDAKISRIDAGIMFVLFIVYVYFTLKSGQEEQSAGEAAIEEKPAAPMNALKGGVLLLIGLALLVFGSSVFVDNASAIARSLGVSEAVIGLTIVACGTSLPELATSVVAALKGNSGIAIGNVLGSNVFNILGILGITGLVSPMAMQGITQVDLTVMVVAMILLWLFSFTRLRVERWEGGLLALTFIGYLVWLLMPYMG